MLWIVSLKDFMSNPFAVRVNMYVSYNVSAGVH